MEVKSNPSHQIDQFLDGKNLPVMEAFYTIQGEGAYQGKPAYFIRLAGCDVGCHWCDVKESWPADDHPVMSVEAIVAEAKTAKSPYVVITGGEPLTYNLQPLCDALHAEGKIINIETSGAYPISGDLDWICFSPKKFKQPLPEFYQAAHELKVIVFHPSDIAWAQNHAAKVNDQCQLFLQPEWSKESEMLPLIIAYVKENPEWKISLQVHKYMNIP